MDDRDGADLGVGLAAWLLSCQTLGYLAERSVIDRAAAVTIIDRALTAADGLLAVDNHRVSARAKQTLSDFLEIARGTSGA